MTGSKKEEAVVVAGEASGEMGEFETRKLWEVVAKGIREGDFEIASKEKSRIEVGYLAVRSYNFADPVHAFVERPEAEEEGRTGRWNDLAFEALPGRRE
jgi:hypothetical protein